MSKEKTATTPQIPPKWQLVAWQKQDEQFSRIPFEWRLETLPGPNVTNYMDIPRTCGILSKAEIAITEDYDATALAEAIRQRRLKCVDVTRAFCKASCLHEPEQS